MYEPLLATEVECLKILVGTKLDLLDGNSEGKAQPRQVSMEAGQDYARKLNADFKTKHPDIGVPFFETSSKTNHRVSDAFTYAFEQCLRCFTKVPAAAAPHDSDGFRLRERGFRVSGPHSSSHSPFLESSGTVRRRKKCCCF